MCPIWIHRSKDFLPIAIYIWVQMMCWCMSVVHCISVCSKANVGITLSEQSPESIPQPLTLLPHHNQNHHISLLYIWRLSVGVITNEYKLGLFYDQLSPVSFISHWERLVTGMQGMQSQCQSHSNHYHLDCKLQIDTHIARCSFKPVPYIWSFERVGCLGGCQGFNVNVNVNWNHAHNIA